ncbi:hypothetical protein F5883DRAFT_146833 [Diaporthe sp. PMI_573]|nr:hypothetical protein F5883DRAFT_146833 [Diaporthaceae sp. PMI_573]
MVIGRRNQEGRTDGRTDGRTLALAIPQCLVEGLLSDAPDPILAVTLRGPSIYCTRRTEANLGLGRDGWEGTKAFAYYFLYYLPTLHTSNVHEPYLYLVFLQRVIKEGFFYCLPVGRTLRLTECNSEAVRVCLVSGFCFLGRLGPAALPACAATLDLICARQQRRAHHATQTLGSCFYAYVLLSSFPMKSAVHGASWFTEQTGSPSNRFTLTLCPRV